MKNRNRSRLLGSAMSAVAGIVALTGLASPAQAQCTLGGTILFGDTVNCDATTTANTTYATNAATGTDRYYVSTGGDLAFLNIGSVVDGYGLGISNDAALFVNNIGGVIVNAGNATAGGTAALDLTGTEVYYLGTSAIINNFAGNGLEIVANDSDGGVAIDAEQHVGVTTANGSAIVLDQTNVAGGSVTLYSDADLTVSNGNGISATSNGVGDIDITNDGDIVEGAGGNLFNGIYVNHGGAGNVLIDSSGNIGDATNRADSGIVASHSIDGDVTINNSGAIYADSYGIDASATGTGDVSVTTSGLIDSGGIGIAADTTTGLLTAEINANVTAASFGAQLATSGGNVDVSGTGNISSTGGIGLDVVSAGGDQVYDLSGTVSGSSIAANLNSNGGAISGTLGGLTSAAGLALVVDSGGGNVDLTIDNAVQADGDAIAINSGDGTIDLTTNGTVSSTNGLGIDLNGGAGTVDLTVNDSVNSALTGIDITTTSGSVTGDVSGDVTSTNAGGILVTTQTGGIDFTTSGDVTALGAASQGVFLQSQGVDANELKLTTAAGSTIQARNVGVHVEQYNNASTGNVTVVNGADIMAPTGGSLSGGILATNQGLGNVDVTNTGDIGTSATPLTGNGIWGYVYNGASSGTLDIDSSGDVYASLGIAGTNLGSGASTIMTGAGVTSGTNTGIAYSGSTGPLTITTGSGLVAGGSIGIGATSTGIQDFNVNGAVTGTGAGSVGLASTTSAARTIDIASGASISGVASAIDLAGNGAATITNDGTLSGPMLVRNTGTGAVTLYNRAGASAVGALAFSDAADTIDNSGTYTFTGSTNLAGGNDIVVNRSGGTMTVNGAIDFGAGTDQMVNDSGGTLNTVTGSTIANLEGLGNNGTMNVAGTLAFSGVAPVFGNAGTLNLTGAAVTGLGATTNQASGVINSTGTSSLSATGTLTNAGTINAGGPLALTTTGAFNNSGTINAASAPVTVAATTLNNTGSINLQDSAIGDTFTVNGNYNGATGARLLIDASDTATDLLIVNGNVTGSTAVDANLIGTGALVVGGLQVADVSGSSSANAFVLGNLTGNAGPLASYSIDQVGSDYYLNASLTAAGFEPLAAAAMVPDLWHPSADEVFANLNVPYKGGPGLGGWVQAFASHDKRGERDYAQTVGGIDYSIDSRIKTTRYGFQGGVDYGLNDTTRIGLTGGYSQHNGKGAVDVDANGWNIGLYAGFGGVSGFHGEFLAKHDRYKLEFQDGTFEGDRLTAKSNGLEGQLGYRVPMSEAEDSNLDIVAGLSHVWNKLDGVSAFGLDYSYDDLDSIRGRVGARYNVGGAMQPYVSATLLHEFSRNGTLSVDDGINALAFETEKKGTWGRIEGGIGGTPNRFPMIAAWADFGDVKGLGARLGMRFGGSAPAPAPAPVIAPPAPVEPAPATQTCYDGSVILATDVCPVPPPPPAPTPAPERG